MDQAAIIALCEESSAPLRKLTEAMLADDNIEGAERALTALRQVAVIRRNFHLSELRTMALGAAAIN